MKYFFVFAFMLLCNEILSLLALIVLLVFFLSDMMKEVGKR